MSTLQTLRFPWRELDHARLEATITKFVQLHGEGLVATRDPESLDPDPDTYIDPDVELDDDDQQDGLTWSFGFPSGSREPGERYDWCSIHFDGPDEDDRGCTGTFDQTDYAERREEAFFDLVESLATTLGGEIEAL